jgi:hypothetical protein
LLALRPETKLPCFASLALDRGETPDAVTVSTKVDRLE